MKNILSKEQFLLIREKLTVKITEAKVGLEHSFIGIIFSSISFVVGKINDKLNQRKMRGLSIMWAVELAKALESYEKNIDNIDEEDSLDNTDELKKEDTIETILGISKDQYLSTLQVHIDNITATNKTTI